MPQILDIMDGDKFSAVELTENNVKNIAFKPQLLGSLGLFSPIHSRTRDIGVVVTEKGLKIIPTSETGAPPEELIPKGGKLKKFRAHRIAKGSTIYEEELQGVLSLESNLERVKEMQAEIADRTGDILDDVELTWEYHRLGAVLGEVLDADNSVLNDWYSEFGATKPSGAAIIDLKLDEEGTDIRGILRQLKRNMALAGQGVWTVGSKIGCLVGDAGFDMLVNHKQYKETKLANERTKELEDIEGYSAVVFEGITFINYRGTDDGKLSIGSEDFRFFPMNTKGAFQVGWAPAEFAPYVNKKGRPLYQLILKDRDRNAWRRPEVYSYPLHICTRPKMLLRGKAK